MWKAINKVLDKDSDSTEISSLYVQDKVLTRKRDIAQALNHHFVTVGPKLSSKIESRQDDDNNNNNNSRYTGHKLWQSLPLEIKESHTLTEFKRKIKKHHFNDCNCRLCRIYLNNLGFL